MTPLAVPGRDEVTAMAVMLGSDVNQGGRSARLETPNGPAHQALICQAQRDADVAPGPVTHVELHGTGTALGGPIEANALAYVVLDIVTHVPGENDTASAPLSRIETKIGHLEAAVGVAGLLKVVLEFGRRHSCRACTTGGRTRPSRWVILGYGRRGGWARAGR